MRGRPLFQLGARLPAYESVVAIPGVEDPAVGPMRNLEHRLAFNAHNRMISDAEIAMTSIDDKAHHEIHLEPILTFRMRGIGYHHPKWVHGQWHGELEMEGEQWLLAEVDDSAFENQHVQHLVRATYAHPDGERVGIGVLEQLILGPHRPYGLEGHW